jgi:hypothetical protein
MADAFVVFSLLHATICTHLPGHVPLVSSCIIICWHQIAFKELLHGFDNNSAPNIASTFKLLAQNFEK